MGIYGATFHKTLKTLPILETLVGTSYDTGSAGVNQDFSQADFCLYDVKIDNQNNPLVGSIGNVTLVPAVKVPVGLRFYPQELTVTNSGAAASGGTGIQLVDTGGNIIASFTTASLGINSTLTLPQSSQYPQTGVVDNYIGLQTSPATLGLGILVSNNGATLTGQLRVRLKGYYGL